MVDGAYQLCVQVWADYYNLTMLIQTCPPTWYVMMVEVDGTCPVLRCTQHVLQITEHHFIFFMKIIMYIIMYNTHTPSFNLPDSDWHGCRGRLRTGLPSPSAPP